MSVDELMVENAVLVEQLRVAKDWSEHNRLQCMSLIDENMALKAKIEQYENQAPTAQLRGVA